MTNEERNELMRKYFTTDACFFRAIFRQEAAAEALHECDRKARAWDELQKRVSDIWGIPNDKEDTFAAGLDYLRHIMREVEWQFVTDAASSDEQDKPSLPMPAHADPILRELWKRVDALKHGASAWAMREATGGGHNAAIAYANVLIEIAKLGGWGDEKH